MSVLVLVGAALLSVRTVRMQDEAAGWVAHSHEVIARLESVAASLSAAETLQRGYLLTDDLDDLAAFQAERTRFEGELQALRRLIADNPQQQQRLPALAATAAERLRLLADNAARHQAGDAQAALLSVRSGRGHALMESARAQLAALRAVEQRLLQQRMATAAQATRLGVAATVGTGVLALVLLVALHLAAMRHTRRLDRERQALQLAREQAEHHQQRLELALDAGGMGFWQSDLDGRHVHWSAREFDLLGVDPAAGGTASAEAFYERVLPEDRVAIRDKLAAVQAVGGDFAHEFRVQHPVRGVRWLAGRGRIVGGEGGVSHSMIGLHWDVTQRRRAEERLREANAGLQRAADDLEHRVAERTAALAEANAELQGFAHTVAHDLRAPLRTMQGFATALLEDEAERLSPEGAEYARRLAASAVRLDGLITDLLAYSRLGRSDVTPERVALEPLLRQLLQELAHDIERSGAQVRIVPPLPEVQAHRPTVAQVLSNLLGNALKFVPSGEAPRIEVGAVRRGGTVQLWVRDHGIGIAAEHQERIFSVFERLHGQERYPGTGIGLAIVRKGVERMGGRVRVDSRPGMGSRFTVELPAADEQAREAA